MLHMLKKKKIKTNHQPNHTNTNLKQTPHRSVGGAGILSSIICVKINEATHQKESVPNDPLTLMGSKSLLREQIIKLPDSCTASP